jgi:hypothetical protein
MGFIKVVRFVFRALARVVQNYITANPHAEDNIYWVADSYKGDPEWFCDHGSAAMRLIIEKMKPLARHELITFTTEVCN